jgi:deoxycytidylate deaminase
MIFGMVGQIGSNIDAIIEYMSDSLKRVEYYPCVVHLTQALDKLKPNPTIDTSAYDRRYHSLIEKADNFCREAESHAALAGLAISEIRRLRTELNASANRPLGEPARGTAYIIRQLKRPQEIELLRKTYGRKFVLISVYLDQDERLSQLADKIQHFDSTPIERDDAEKRASELISRDASEIEHDFGQRVADIFHQADVILVGRKDATTKEAVDRFIKALFGHNGVSPTKSEYGMYAATSASLRSLDLSRQVGASIFSSKGELISQGCNEVPKPFGGTYWSDDPQQFRDFELGRDENHFRKVSILHDLLERLGHIDALALQFTNGRDVSEQVRELLKSPVVSQAKIMDIIEYGRMIHAEMSALMDAARIGRSVMDGTLFCTTFPCHVCAKHIVAAGVAEVVFLEPYPKSKARDLNPDSITFSPDERSSKVLFRTFVGITPRRYRDIFEKGKRKDGGGRAVDWYEGHPAPRVEDRSHSYLENEQPSITVSLELWLKKQSVAKPAPKHKTPTVTHRKTAGRQALGQK